MTRRLCDRRSNAIERSIIAAPTQILLSSVFSSHSSYACIIAGDGNIYKFESQYKKDTVRKLQVGYNHAFRRIMKYDRTCSASGMFVANGVMSFNELWRKSLYNFKQRVTKSNNFIVNHVYNFTRATSKIWKNSDHILYIL